MKPKVFVTRPLPAPALELLSGHCEVRSYAEDAAIPVSQLAEECRQVEGLLVSSARVNEEVLLAASNLRAISNCGVGYDNIAALLQGHMGSGPALRLLLVKAVIWSVALGSGTSGGVLAPLLMMGGAVGVLPRAPRRRHHSRVRTRACCTRADRWSQGRDPLATLPGSSCCSRSARSNRFRSAPRSRSDPTRRHTRRRRARTSG